jgi:hypothetical protein
MSQFPSVGGARSRTMTDDATGGNAGLAGEGRGNILLFEDDETLATLLARVLRNEGYKVDLLDRADALPGAAKLAKYDVVL